MTSAIKTKVVVDGVAFEITEISLRFSPVLPWLSKRTLIVAPAPGAMGVLGQSFATVQPQDVLTSAKTSADVPEFTKANSTFTALPSAMIPKFLTVSVKSMAGREAVE